MIKEFKFKIERSSFKKGLLHIVILTDIHKMRRISFELEFWY